MRKGIIGIFFALILFLFCSFANATLITFWGTVKIDNNYAPSGVVIEAYDDKGNLLANRTTMIYDGKSYYVLDISAEGRVIIKVAGVEINEGAQEIGEGGSRELNISINRLQNGASCYYDIACISGYCRNGICSERTPSGGGGGGAPSYYTGPSYFTPKCELAYEIKVPEIIKGYVNEILKIPINVSITKATCAPVDIAIDLKTPWEMKSTTLKSLKDKENRSAIIEIIPKEKGEFYIFVNSNNITERINLIVEEKEVIVTTTLPRETTTIEIVKNETTTIKEEQKGLLTGFFTLISKDPFAVIYILFAIVIIFLIIRKILNGTRKKEEGGRKR